MEKHIVLGDLSKPEIIKRLENYLRELYRLSGVIYTTTAPNGSITAERGRLALYNNSGTYTVWINKDGDTAWQQV